MLAAAVEAVKMNERTACEMFQYRDKTMTLECLKAVVTQLGYHPYNVISAVVAPADSDCSADQLHPLVAVLYPLNENKVNGRYASSMGEGRKPFPTTTWIVSRDLYARISKVEDMGWIQKLQNRLLKGPDPATTEGVENIHINSKTAGDAPRNPWLSQMHEAHRRYASFRWSLLSDEDKEFIQQKGW
jgi:Protein of unknown function (DUF501)